MKKQIIQLERLSPMELVDYLNARLEDRYTIDSLVSPGMGYTNGKHDYIIVVSYIPKEDDE